MPSTIIAVYFIICGSLGLIMWFKMLTIIEKKGLEVNYFFTNPKYFFTFSKLIQKEENPVIKNEYRLLLWGQILLIPIYFFGMIILINITI